MTPSNEKITARAFIVAAGKYCRQNFIPYKIESGRLFAYGTWFSFDQENNYWRAALRIENTILAHLACPYSSIPAMLDKYLHYRGRYLAGSAVTAARYFQKRQSFRLPV